MFKATPRLAFWKLTVVALCLCVFIFGTHARLVQYQSFSSEGVTTISSNLWLDDHRMEIQAGLELASLVVLSVFSWLAVSLSEFPVQWAVLDAPIPLRSSALWQLRRFFRPPPAL